MSKPKILIIDKITQDIEDMKYVLSRLSDSSVSYEQTIDYYNNNEYEYIIMDHSCKGSDDYLEYILTKNPLQKFILLSDSLNCPVECTFCLNTFKFVRLLKPVNLVEVLSYIKNKLEFECPNKYIFENIDSIEKLHKLINLSGNHYYIKKEIIDDCLYFIPKNGRNKNINVYEFDKIHDLINKDFFEISVNQDYHICVKENNM